MIQRAGDSICFTSKVSDKIDTKLFLRIPFRPLAEICAASEAL